MSITGLWILPMNHNANIHKYNPISYQKLSKQIIVLETTSLERNR